MTDPDRPSTPSLIGAAIRQATALFSTEIKLARLEATEKLVAALLAIVSLFVAAIFIIVALIFLLQGLVEWLVARGWPAFAASFAIGGAIAAIALIAILIAIRRLSLARLKPQRTLRQVKVATDIVKGKPS